jgi:hypothetical protein
LRHAARKPTALHLGVVEHHFPALACRALPPLRAMADRCDFESALARAGPPFKPPRCPSFFAAFVTVSADSPFATIKLLIELER